VSLGPSWWYLETVLDITQIPTNLRRAARWFQNHGYDVVTARISQEDMPVIVISTEPSRLIETVDAILATLKTLDLPEMNSFEDGPMVSGTYAGGSTGIICVMHFEDHMVPDIASYN